ncbi:MAG: hypothetical protein WA231_21305 [Methylocella sp.]
MFGRNSIGKGKVFSSLMLIGGLMYKWVVGAPGFQTVVILGALVSLIKIFAT